MEEIQNLTLKSKADKNFILVATNKSIFYLFKNLDDYAITKTLVSKLGINGEVDVRFKNKFFISSFFDLSEDSFCDYINVNECFLNFYCKSYSVAIKELNKSGCDYNDEGIEIKSIENTVLNLPFQCMKYIRNYYSKQKELKALRRREILKNFDIKEQDLDNKITKCDEGMII